MNYGNAVFEARAMLAMLGDRTEYASSCESGYTDNNTRNNGNNEKPISLVNDNEIARNIKIYPNPAKDNITIEYTLNSEQSGQILIFDAIGNKIVSQKLNSKQNNLQISTDRWLSGIYTCKISINNETVIVKKLTIIK